MTTPRKLMRALATARAVAADLMGLAEQDPDARARRAFAEEAARAGRMVERLERRLAEVLRAEPQYAGLARTRGREGREHAGDRAGLDGPAAARRGARP